MKNTWKHASASINCGLVTVYQVTTRPTHLYLCMTTSRPGETPSMSFPDDNNPPHRKSFRFITERIIEQEEPGETTQHTFQFQWPTLGTMFWCISTDDVRPTAGTAFSPIFAYMIQWENIEYVTDWTTAFKSPNPWQADLGILVTHNVVSRDVDWYESRAGSPIVLRSPPLGGFFGSPLCNQWVSLVPSVYIPNIHVTSFRFYIEFAFVPRSITNNNIRSLDLAGRSTPNTSGAPAAQVGWLTPNKGPRIISLYQLYHMPALFGQTAIYEADPRLDFIRYTAATDTGVFNNQSYGFGAVRVATSASQLLDVSSLWRTMRLRPSPIPDLGYPQQNPEPNKRWLWFPNSPGQSINALPSLPGRILDLWLD